MLFLGRRAFLGMLPLLAAACRSRAAEPRPYQTPRPVGDFITGPLNTAGWTDTATTGAFSRTLTHTGYGKSTLRNYALTLDLTLDAAGGSVGVGVQSQRNSGQNASTYARLDAAAGQLQLVGLDAAGRLGVVAASVPVAATPGAYQLRLEMVEDVAQATLSRGGTVVATVRYQYDFTTPYAGNIIKPNIFLYSAALAGPGIMLTGFTASSTECRNPEVVFVGDSITVGFYGGRVTNAPAYLLRASTGKTIQVMAGGYDMTQDVVDNLPEIISMAPRYVFLQIGTNDQAHASDSQALPLVQGIVATLQDAGIVVTVLATPDGGDPARSGTYNHALASAHQGFIDTWTSGWRTMSLANREMIDALHPTLAGNVKIAGIIQQARPALFC